MSPASHSFDVLIVGSGLAGLSAALHLAPTHRVAVITKRSLNDGSSRWAQGGIAAVMGEGDTLASHVQDTLVAGAGHASLGSVDWSMLSLLLAGSLSLFSNAALGAADTIAVTLDSALPAPPLGDEFRALAPPHIDGWYALTQITQPLGEAAPQQWAGAWRAVGAA